MLSIHHILLAFILLLVGKAFLPAKRTSQPVPFPSYISQPPQPIPQDDESKTLHRNASRLTPHETPYYPPSIPIQQPDYSTFVTRGRLRAFREREHKSFQRRHLKAPVFIYLPLQRPRIETVKPKNELEIEEEEQENEEVAEARTVPLPVSPPPTPWYRRISVVAAETKLPDSPLEPDEALKVAMGMELPSSPLPRPLGADEAFEMAVGMELPCSPIEVVEAQMNVSAGKIRVLKWGGQRAGSTMTKVGLPVLIKRRNRLSKPRKQRARTKRPASVKPWSHGLARRTNLHVLARKAAKILLSQNRTQGSHRSRPSLECLNIALARRHSIRTLFSALTLASALRTPGQATSIANFLRRIERYPSAAMEPMSVFLDRRLPPPDSGISVFLDGRLPSATVTRDGMRGKSLVVELDDEAEKEWKRRYALWKEGSEKGRDMYDV